MQMPTRFVARAAAVVTPLGVAVLSAGAAHADEPTSWQKGGDGINGLDALLLFVGIPLGLSVVIGLLASITTRGTPKRYRPTQTWDAEPEWFGAPDPGAPKALSQEPSSQEPFTDGSEPSKPGGGASATW